MRPEHWLFTIPLRLRSLFRRVQADKELDEELRDHVEQKTQEYVAKGLPLKEARRQALLEMGGVEKRKEECRDARRVNWIQDLIQDLRYGVRMLRKSPVFTTVAIVTLALGIGANAAIFSVIDAILLRPLPYPNPSRLVTISESNRPNDPTTRNEVAPGNFLDWRERNHVFEQIAAVNLLGYNITGKDQPERVLGAAVSAGLLHMLGLRPVLGRDFEPADDHYGAAPVALLSYSLWQRRFGGDAAVVGQPIRLGITSYAVVGVLPSGMTFPDPDVALWVPLEQATTPKNMHWRDSHYFDVYARLKPAVTFAQAGDDMNSIAAQLKRENPDTNSGAGTLVMPMQQDLVGDIRPALLTLLVAVGFVLLIACSNVANLLLVRASGRAKEFAVRRALGAGHSRLLRQMLTETVLLSLAGGAVGLMVAGWTRQVLLAMRPASLPQFNSIRTDGRVLLFTFVVSLVTGLLFGLVPGLRAASLGPDGALHGTSRGSTLGRGTQRLRAVFVTAEIALSLILVVGAGLSIRSFLLLLGNNLGFRADHTLTARISIPIEKYATDDQVVSFYDRLLERVRGVPGVEFAGMTSFLPLTGRNFDNSFDIVGLPPRPPSDQNYALVRFVDPQYFGVLDIPILGGRGIEIRDRLGSPRSVVISDSMARRYWPNKSPIGQHLLVYMGQDQSPWEVVGVVGDVRTNIAAERDPTIYFPYAQTPYRYMVLAVRTHADPDTMIQSIRDTARRLDPDQPIYQVRTISQLIAETLVPWRFSMTLLGVFAALALVLASAGVYGVMAYFVAERSPEIGIRMAFGASRADVWRLVMKQGFRFTWLGIAIGVAGAVALTRLMTVSLYRVSAIDPFTFTGVVVLLAGVAFAACYIPARRAMRVDPMIALRYE